VLLLEKENQVGGKVAQDSWGKSQYTVAAGYMADPYIDDIKAMFKDLEIKGEKIPEPTNAFYASDGKIVYDPFGKGLDQLPEPEKVKRDIITMAKDMGALSKNAQLGDVP